MAFAICVCPKHQPNMLKHLCSCFSSCPAPREANTQQYWSVRRQEWWKVELYERKPMGRNQKS